MKAKKSFLQNQTTVDELTILRIKFSIKKDINLRFPKSNFINNSSSFNMKI